jgi:hypothetical protein
MLARLSILIRRTNDNFRLVRHPLAIGGKLQKELHPDIIARQTEQPCAS